MCTNFPRKQKQRRCIQKKTQDIFLYFYKFSKKKTTAQGYTASTQNMFLCFCKFFQEKKQKRRATKLTRETITTPIPSLPACRHSLPITTSLALTHHESHFPDIDFNIPLASKSSAHDGSETQTRSRTPHSGPHFRTLHSEFHFQTPQWDTRHLRSHLQ